MIINTDTCIGCEECLAHCPTSAIKMNQESAFIDLDFCTECGNCKRSGICPVDAIEMDELIWPRSIRNIFSDPLSVYQETGVSGRGTEESKTNDVTNRFKFGEVGFCIDVGRPNSGGVHLREVDKISRELAKLNVIFDPSNPLTHLMEDPIIGKLKDEVLDEFVVSAIIEFKTALDNCTKVIKALEEIGKKVNTIFSVGVISVVNEDWTIPAAEVIRSEGIPIRPNGKTTLNLGRCS